MIEENKDQNTGDASEDTQRQSGSGPGLDRDLQDSPHDQERMQSEEVILDLPDVRDIPGQENILPPQMESFADTTISSDDEEGVGLFDDDDEDEDTDLVMGTDADVSDEEKQTLEQADETSPDGDDTRLRASELDSTDFEGETLNEAASDVSGGDLDTSGVDGDDPMEAIGEEDEENNTYSLGSDDNDNVTEGTP